MFDDYTRLTEGQICPVSTIESITGEQISLAKTEIPGTRDGMTSWLRLSCPLAVSANWLISGYP
ncbi:MAG: hypothetical protein ISS19_13230 [Bacteroidales bacterium]|nr:hypothetical protein [Bacteroidales bacterium]